MKRYIIILALLVFPLNSYAAEKTPVPQYFCLGDHKCYDINKILKLFCFMNFNCYDIKGNYVPAEVITGVKMPNENASPKANEVVPTPTPQPTPTPKVEYKNCVDLQIVGSSDGTLTTCQYFIRKTDGELQTQVIQAKFVAEVIDGKATKKIVPNTGNAIYLDKDNIQVK